MNSDFFNGRNPMQMMQAFQHFKQSFNGDPQAEVMKLVQSGRISQQQLNELQGAAQTFQQMMRGMRL